MTIEEARIKLSKIKNSYSIRNYFCTDMTHQEKALIDYENLVIGLIKEKQELIEYLKKEIEILENIPKDEEMTIEAHGRLNAYRIILYKLEKSDK